MRGDAAAQAVVKGAGRWRSGPRCDQGFGRPARRLHAFADRAERGRRGKRDRARLAGCGHRSAQPELYRGPRHRHPARRPDRDQRAQAGLCTLYRRPWLLPYRVGQSQSRPCRGCSRHRRGTQGAAADETRQAAGAGPLRAAEPPYQSRRFTARDRPRGHRLAGSGRTEAGRRQLLWILGHQRPCGAGGVSRAAHVRHPPGRAGAGAAVGAQRTGLAGAGCTVAGASRATRAGSCRAGLHAANRPRGDGDAGRVHGRQHGTTAAAAAGLDRRRTGDRLRRGQPDGRSRPGRRRHGATGGAVARRRRRRGGLRLDAPLWRRPASGTHRPADVCLRRGAVLAGGAGSRRRTQHDGGCRNGGGSLHGAVAGGRRAGAGAPDGAVDLPAGRTSAAANAGSRGRRTESADRVDLHCRRPQQRTRCRWPLPRRGRRSAAVAGGVATAAVRSRQQPGALSVGHG